MDEPPGKELLAPARLGETIWRVLRTLAGTAGRANKSATAIAVIHHVIAQLGNGVVMRGHHEGRQGILLQ